MDRETVMDPAASPSRPGVRRVNNVPVAILGAAVAVFMAIMVYVAAGRAAEQDGRHEEEPVRSALAVAKTVAGSDEAGVVPAAADPQGGGAAAASSRAAPAAGANTKGDFPAPPPPPPRLPAADDDVLLPPQSDAAGLQEADDSAHYAVTEDDARRELEGMQLELFKQAVRAKTGALTQADAPSARGEVERARPSAHVANADGSYVEKLRQLQAVGLLPEGAPDDSRDKSDAYSQFAGDEHEDRWALASEQQMPGSPYELRAGAVIPATLQTGINSDLPGQITAIVAQDVRDSARGRYVLIPQGARLVGTYGSDVKYGQERVLVAWQRIVWPDGKALDIGAMPGADGAGYAGFKDQVDNHFWRLLGSALLLSGITGGIAYSQDSQAQDGNRVTVGGTMSQALGQQLGQVTEEMIRRQMNVAPTIEIRPGYRFNVSVTKDLTFHAPYRAFDYERSITTDSQTFRQSR